MTASLRRVALAPMLTIVLAGSACGSPARSGTSPNAWAHAVCQALDTWKNNLGTRTERVKTDASPTASPADQRALLTTFLGDTVTITDTMLGRLDAAGRPAVDHGAQLARDLRDKLAEARTTLAMAKERAAALSDDPQAFSQQAGSLAADIESAGKKLDEGLNGLDTRYHSTALNRAFDRDVACKSLKA